jgi:hypothetical protein
MEEVFNRLIKENITPNAYYVLHCIRENVKPANYVNHALECKRLQTDGWLTQNLKLNNKSIIFTDEINSFFKRAKKKTSRDLMGDSFSIKIEEYINIFPNKKLNSGKYARVNPKNLEVTFRWFFENYEYDWETIINATKKYVDEYSLKNYEYMRTAQYFIRKQNTDKTFDSDLATYCQLVNSGYDEDNFDVFKDLVT